MKFSLCIKTPRSLYLDCFSLGIGALLIFAFAPFHQAWLASACPGLLLCVFLGISPQRACWRGYLFGLGFFGCGASWIYISIHHFGNANVALAAFITSLFILALS